MLYDQYLDAQFSTLLLTLVKHDTSLSGMPCYIEVFLGKTPKDKGGTAKDLGNYIYRRFGISYQQVPEYRGKGKSATIRFFLSWEDIQPLRAEILKVFNKPETMLKCREYLPFEFNSLIIQDAA